MDVVILNALTDLNVLLKMRNVPNAKQLDIMAIVVKAVLVLDLEARTEIVTGPKVNQDLK